MQKNFTRYFTRCILERLKWTYSTGSIPVIRCNFPILYHLWKRLEIAVYLLFRPYFEGFTHLIPPLRGGVPTAPVIKTSHEISHIHQKSLHTAFHTRYNV